MAITQKTTEEAIKYIQDSIENWKSAGQDRKIISLSNWAEKWRSNTGSTTAKIRSLQKNIKGIEQIIKRSQKEGIQGTVLDDQLKEFKDQYNSLVSKYGEPKTKAKKGQTKLTRVEKDTNSTHL